MHDLRSFSAPSKMSIISKELIRSLRSSTKVDVNAANT